MIRLLASLFIVVCLGFGISACSDDGGGSSSPQVKQVAAKPPAAKKDAPTQATEEKPKEPEFKYVSAGRRDPFVPLSKIKKPLTVKQEEPATPLQSYDLPQFRLIGIIVGKGAPKAMVSAPDGKSYVLAKGTKIGKNDGVIEEISADAVSVREKYYDFSGNVIENVQEITVPK